MKVYVPSELITIVPTPAMTAVCPVLYVVPSIVNVFTVTVDPPEPISFNVTEPFSAVSSKVLALSLTIWINPPIVKVALLDVMLPHI